MDRIEKIKEFLQSTPNDSFLNHALALEYIKIGKLEEARELFEKILKNEPQYVGSYYHLGRTLEKTGKPKEALEVYEKGMAECKKVGDNHAYNELQMAKDDLED